MKVLIPHLPTRFDRATNKRVPSLDINPAADWGTLTSLVNPEMVVNSHTLAAAVDEARESLEREMAPGDCILCVGDLALVGCVIAWVMEREGAVRLLRWDKNARKYELVEVEA